MSGLGGDRPVDRPATTDDVDAILGLWQRGGVEHNPETDRDEIITKLDFDGDLFLVAGGRHYP